MSPSPSSSPLFRLSRPLNYFSRYTLQLTVVTRVLPCSPSSNADFVYGWSLGVFLSPVGVAHLNPEVAAPEVLALALVFPLEERAVLGADRPAAAVGAEGGRREQREVAAEADRPGRRFGAAVEGPLHADEVPEGDVPRRHEFPEFVLRVIARLDQGRAGLRNPDTASCVAGARLPSSPPLRIFFAHLSRNLFLSNHSTHDPWNALFFECERNFFAIPSTFQLEATKNNDSSVICGARKSIFCLPKRRYACWNGSLK